MFSFHAGYEMILPFALSQSYSEQTFSMVKCNHIIARFKPKIRCFFHKNYSSVDWRTVKIVEITHFLFTCFAAASSFWFCFV